MVSILLCLFYFSNPIQAEQINFFNPGFKNYIDGPTLGHDGRLYFANDDKIMHITGSLVETFFELNKSLKQGESPGKISALEITPEGDLIFSDYINHAVWKIPKKINTYRKDLIELVVKDERMGQPNDLAALPNGDYLFADHAKKGSSRKSGIWKFEAASKKLTFLETGGSLSGIAVNKKNSRVFVTSGSPCFIAQYEIQEDQLKKIWKTNCSPDWSVDGIELNQKGDLFVTRIEQGRIDSFEGETGKALTQTCLLERLQPKKCDKKTKYEAGLNPTDIHFIDADTAAVSFMGDKNSNLEFSQGFVRLIKIK